MITRAARISLVLVAIGMAALIFAGAVASTAYDVVAVWHLAKAQP